MDETNKSYFLWLDYVLFGSTLGINVIIGIYFGYCVKKQNTIDEYLNGGKKMKMLPIAASLIASEIGTNTLLAVPADVYRFGANYIWLGLAMLIQCLLGYFILLPVLYKLQLTTVFEYLELRFDRRLKLLASFFNVLSIFIFYPMTIYVPALAFSQATGVNVTVIAVISSVLCIFYTTAGGFKAVVWTDALQLVIMIISFFAMFCIGISSVGGFHVKLESTSVLNIFLGYVCFQGALFGGHSGVVFVSFVFIQNQRYQSSLVLAQHLKPISNEGCNMSFVQNVTNIMNQVDDLPFFMYRISFWFNTIMGTTVTIIVGVVISLFTKHDRSPLPKELLCPLLYSYSEENLPDNQQNELM